VLSYLAVFSILFVALVSRGGWDVPFQALISVISALAILTNAGYFLLKIKKNSAPNLFLLRRQEQEQQEEETDSPNIIEGYFVSSAAVFAAFFIFTAYLLARFFFEYKKSFAVAALPPGGVSNIYNEFVNWATYGAVYLSVTGLVALHKERAREFVFKSVMWLGCFAAAFFLIQKFFTIQGPSDYSTWGFLPKKNVFNSVVFLALLVFIGSWRTSTLLSAGESAPESESGEIYRKKSASQWVCFALVAAACVMSVTVSNFIGFIAASVFLLIRRHRGGDERSASFQPLLRSGGYNRRVLIFASVVFIAVAALKLTEPNVTDRVLWYKAALRMFAANPLTGVGAGNFGKALPGYLENGHHLLRTIYAHSFYLETLSETGVIGFVILAVLLYFVLKKTEDRRSLAVALFLLSTAATDFIFSFTIIPVFFFALMAAGRKTAPVVSYDGKSIPSSPQEGKDVSSSSCCALHKIIFLTAAYALFLFTSGAMKYFWWHKEYLKEVIYR